MGLSVSLCSAEVGPRRQQWTRHSTAQQPCVNVSKFPSSILHPANWAGPRASLATAAGPLLALGSSPLAMGFCNQTDTAVLPSLRGVLLDAGWHCEDRADSLRLRRHWKPTCLSWKKCLSIPTGLVPLQKPDSLGLECFLLRVPTGQRDRDRAVQAHRTRGPDLSTLLRGGEQTQGGCSRVGVAKRGEHLTSLFVTLEGLCTMQPKGNSL